MPYAFKPYSLQQVLRATKAWRLKNYPEKGELKCDPRLLKLETVLKRDWSPTHRHLYDLVDALLPLLWHGKDVPKLQPYSQLLHDDSFVELVPAIAVVPLGKDNGHNYKLNRVCVIAPQGGNRAFGWDEAFKSRNNMCLNASGNHLTHTKSLLQPATDDEIRQWFLTFDKPLPSFFTVHYRRKRLRKPKASHATAKFGLDKLAKCVNAITTGKDSRDPDWDTAFHKARGDRHRDCYERAIQAARKAEFPKPSLKNSRK